ncbi:MAG: D-aminoacyl-tRNA deacylase [Candidatus Ornithospirochaeta sp.]|nr:D-aminoacyl-tRNA deacylase [Candidatus Ornithospirochaeta sp.]
MKAVIQRARDASCTVEGRITGAIDKGLVVFFCVEKGDKEEWLEPFLSKIAKLRIFPDDNGKMNLSLLDVKQAILLISQFTLAADIYKGNRPSFDGSEEFERANGMYLKAADMLRSMGIRTETGEFGAHMDIAYINDGPLNFVLDSRNLKSCR